MSETAEQYASRMLASHGAGWKSIPFMLAHYEALVKFERTEPQREARYKKIVEETKQLSREELEQRLLDLLTETERQSENIDLFQGAQKFIHNKTIGILEQVEQSVKDSFGLKTAIEAFEKVTSEFIELIKDTRKHEEVYLKEIEETRKVRQKMIVETEAYNKLVLELNKKSLEFDKKVKRFNKRAREFARQHGMRVA